MIKKRFVYYSLVCFLLSVILLSIFPVGTQATLPQELVFLRTESSKTYDLGNGKYRLVSSIGAIHYKDNYADKNEHWKDIDLTWDGNRITKAPYELTRDGKKLTFKDKKTGEVSTIELLSVVPAGIPFEIIPESSAVRFQHILPSDKIPFEARFKVTGKAPITRAFDDNSDLELETILVDGVLTEKLSQIKDKGTGQVRPAKGSIRVDPTLTVQPSAKDTYLSSVAPTTNYGTGVYLYAGGTAGDIYRAILEFSLAALPGAATVTAATLSLYYASWAGGNPNGRTYWAYKLTRTDWVEAEATWNIYKTANNWTAAGGDYVTSSPAGGSTTVPASTANWMNWNVLAIIQDAQSSSISAEFLVKDAAEDSVTVALFRSKDYGTASLRPKLVIEYTPPLTVSTGVVLNIQTDEAIITGSVSSGNADERGFDWGTSQGVYTDSWTEVGSFGIGTFDYLLESLESETTYYFRAKAYNIGGWSYGSEHEFTTEKKNLFVTGANQLIPFFMVGTMIFVVVKAISGGGVLGIILAGVLMLVFWNIYPSIISMIASIFP